MRYFYKHPIIKNVYKFPFPFCLLRTAGISILPYVIVSEASATGLLRLECARDALGAS